MDTPEMDPDPKKLVRAYSDQLKTENDQSTLGQSLIRQEARDEQEIQQRALRQRQWNLFIQGTGPTATDSSEERLLHDKGQKLLEAWRKFTRKLNARLPPNQQIVIDQTPRFDMLQEAVHDAQSSLRARRDGTVIGRSHGRLANVIQSFDDYKDLLGVIPSDDKYICLLTGTLSAFAKASMNHEETADGIDDALELVRENMQFWRRQMRIYHGNAFMRSYIIQLYVLIFEMYTDIFVDWSSSKWSRFLNSFNSQFFARTVSERVSKMKELGNNLEREAKLATEDKIHRELITKKEMAKMIFELEERLGRRVQISRRDDASEFIQAQSAGRLTSTLTTNDHSSAIAPQLNASEAPAQTSLVSSTTSPQLSAIPLFQRILSRLTGAKPELQSQIYQQLVSKAENVVVDVSAYRGVRRWVQGGDQPCLWLQGPYDVSYPSQNTLTATYLVSLAKRLQIPVISHFCQKPASALSVESFLSESLMAMAQGLVLQLLDQFDETDIPTSSLTAIETVLSNAKVDSVQGTILLLAELIKSRRRPLFCIIDNIFLLENQSHSAHTDLLRRFIDAIAPEGAIVAEFPIRTCFTTDAHSTVLGDLLNAARAVRVEFETQTDDGEGEDDRYLDTLGLQPWTRSH